MARTFSDLVRNAVPWWLDRGVMSDVLAAIGEALDDLQTNAVDAVKYRHGTAAYPDGLPYHARDRRIRRGPGESDAAYAARLPRWLDAHATRGNPYEFLRQIQDYWSASEVFELDVVYEQGRRYSRDVSGDVTRSDGTPWVYNDTGPDWARWWLLLKPTAALHADGDPIVVPREWNALHCEGACIVSVLVNGAHVWGEPDLEWDGGWTWDSGDDAYTIDGV